MDTLANINTLAVFVTEPEVLPIVQRTLMLVNYEFWISLSQKAVLVAHLKSVYKLTIKQT